MNSIDFRIPFSGMSNLRFTHCFATTYMFLENIDISGEFDKTCKGGNPCNGCGIGGCKTAVNHVAWYYFLFDTMTGCNSLRCRYNGKPTEMQTLVVGIDDKSSCGTDYVVDFLFGFVGYEYRKCTDSAGFKDEIITSIDAGKPVIAEVKTGRGRFHLLTGYDGDSLICPDYGAAWHKPKGPPAFDELVALYIVGGKTTPRYTLRDGLERVRRVMEYNIDEKLWDEYLIKLGGWGKFPSADGLDQANPEEIKMRLRRVYDTMGYIWDSHQFRMVFRDYHEGWYRDDCYKEMRDPALTELRKKIYKECGPLVNAGHYFNRLNGKVDWYAGNPSEIPGISEEICKMIVKIKKIDIKLLGYIKQAIEILV